jgi:MFS family permease
LERVDKVNRAGVLTLLFARIIYAINWFNIASIFSYIASDFKQDVSLLGLIAASFFIGIGIFQVPGGILTAIYGTIIASSAALLCGLSSQLQQIEVLRFVVGLGMAFFFGPSVTLITRYLGRRSEGLAVGLLNSAHSVGGIMGLFGWVIIAEIIGWRQSLLVSGGLGLISSLLLIVLLPRKEEEQESGRGFEIKVSDICRVLFDKSLLRFGLVLLGAQIAWGLTLTFVVFYLEDYLKINSSMSGLVGSLSLIFALVAAPVFGRIYDRIRNIKKLLFVCGLAMSSSIAAISSVITNTSTAVYIVVISTVLVGIFSAGVFTIAYAAAKEAYRIRRRNEANVERRRTITPLQSEYNTLAISWVNGLSLFGAFWVPIIFSFIVHYLGYPIAWLLGGIFSLLFILPTLGIKTFKDKNKNAI